jgi:putative hemolysin
MFEKIYSNRSELTNLFRFKDTYPKYIIKTADTKKEQRQAQQLRYKVFADEIKAITDSKGLLKKREVDSYDEESQHIIVKVKTGI